MLAVSGGAILAGAIDRNPRGWNLRFASGMLVVMGAIGLLGALVLGIQVARERRLADTGGGDPWLVAAGLPDERPVGEP